LKSPARKRFDSLKDDSDDHEGVNIDVTDTKSLRQLDDVLSKGDFRHMVQELNTRVHPDAGEYLELVMQGYNLRDIFGVKTGEPMLPYVAEHPMTFQNWNATIQPKIKKVLQKYIH